MTGTRAVLRLAAAALVLAVLGGVSGWGIRHARSAATTSTVVAPPSISPTVAATPSAATATPSPPRRRVDLIGDSLLYSSGLSDDRALSTLLSRDRPDLDVLDLAVGGSEVNDLLSRVRQFTLPHPDEAVVWIGGNDADDHVPLDVFREQLQQLIADLAPAHVVLVTPVADYSVDPSLYVPFAGVVRSVAGAQGLPLLDLAGRIQRSDFQVDGAHLDAAATLRVTRLLEPLL